MDTPGFRKIFTLTAALTLALSALQQLSTPPPAWAQSPPASAGLNLNLDDLPRWEVELRPTADPIQNALETPTKKIKRTLLDQLNADDTPRPQVSHFPQAPQHSLLGATLTSRFELRLVLPAAGSPAAQLGAEFQPSRNRLDPSEINGVASDFLSQLLTGAPSDFPIACDFQPAGPQAATELLGTLTCVQGVWLTETSHWKKTAKKISVPRPIHIARNRLRRSIRGATRALAQCLGHCPPVGSRSLDEHRSFIRRGRERVTVSQKTAPTEALNAPGLSTLASGCEKNRAALLSKIQLALSQSASELEQLRLTAKTDALEQLEAEQRENQKSLDSVQRALDLATQEKTLRKEIDTASQDLMFQIPNQAKVIIQLDISPSILQRGLLDYAVANVSFLIQRLKPEQSFNLIFNSWSVFTLANHVLLPANPGNKAAAIAMLQHLKALSTPLLGEDSYSTESSRQLLSREWSKILHSDANRMPRYYTYASDQTLPNELRTKSSGEPNPAYYLADATKADLVLSFTDGEYHGKPQEFSGYKRRQGSSYTVQLKPMLSKSEYDSYSNYENQGYSLEKLISETRRDKILSFTHQMSDFTEIERLLSLLDQLIVQKESLAKQLYPAIKKLNRSALNPQDDWLSSQPKSALDALATQFRQELDRLNAAIEVERTKPEVAGARAQAKALEAKIQALQDKQTQVFQQPCPDSAPN